MPRIKSKKRKNKKSFLSSAGGNNHNNKQISPKKQKVLICADSHGHNLAFHLNKNSTSFEAVGFVRPGGLSEQILNSHNIDGEALGPDDVLVIACGSNDVARNETEKAITSIKETLEKYKSSKIILVDLPTRHDLRDWSCVNNEIRKSNESLEAISVKFTNVSLVKSSIADRQLHTRHGMHFNYKGKQWLAQKICEELTKGTQPELPTSQENIRMQSPLVRDESNSNTEHLQPHNGLKSTEVTCILDLTSSSEPLPVEEKEKQTSSDRLSSVSDVNQTNPLNLNVWPPLKQK
ncbi:hypothetical protein J6590_108405 [Homalodisca vitripennis]|nr:hypothetical protein J6590_108405 [Homalodisca vitripennis]